MVDFGSDANFEAKSARLDLAGESRRDPVLVAKLAPVGQRGNPPSWLRSIAPPPPARASALWGYHGYVSYFARKISGSGSTKLSRDKHTNTDKCQPLKCLSRNRSGEFNGYSKGKPEESPGSDGHSLTARGLRTNGLAEFRGLPLNLKPPPLEGTRLLDGPLLDCTSTKSTTHLEYPPHFHRGPETRRIYLSGCERRRDGWNHSNVRGVPGLGIATLREASVRWQSLADNLINKGVEWKVL
ncbi:hypothetical protein CCHR01_09329 [Colletotrichum chrysophilum]|uniref:Uncharacterized protein n=1 Tax=Colletotrichum chrysophilum TaxID=1836956 RepID=A0AAD9AH25_9PEZI|nr:hypothetical protein CCHR01_09329 [Colletotrichum chrysophilum]